MTNKTSQRGIDMTDRHPALHCEPTDLEKRLATIRQREENFHELFLLCREAARAIARLRHDCHEAVTGWDDDRAGWFEQAQEWRSEVERLTKERNEVRVAEMVAKDHPCEVPALRAEAERLRHPCATVGARDGCTAGEQIDALEAEVERLRDIDEAFELQSTEREGRERAYRSTVKRAEKAEAEVERLRVMLLEHANGARERGETCHVCRGAALAEEEP